MAPPRRRPPRQPARPDRAIRPSPRSTAKRARGPAPAGPDQPRRGPRPAGRVRRPGRGRDRAGLELERRFVTKRIYHRAERDEEDFFWLRSDGPIATTADGVRLHTEIDEADVADPERPTLVLVHGYALSLDCWHFQRKHFRDRDRQVLYDQRSHGRSGRSAPERCRVPQLAEDLPQVLDELIGDRPVVLVGHSMGGMTIMHLALTRPDWFGDPDQWRRPLLHRGRGDGRLLADPGAAGADLHSDRAADHGRPQPDPRGRRTWPDRRIRPGLRLHQGWRSVPTSRPATSSS